LVPKSTRIKRKEIKTIRLVPQVVKRSAKQCTNHTAKKKSSATGIGLSLLTATCFRLFITDFSL